MRAHTREAVADCNPSSLMRHLDVRLPAWPYQDAAGLCFKILICATLANFLAFVSGAWRSILCTVKKSRQRLVHRAIYRLPNNMESSNCKLKGRLRLHG